jgi:hypothetical protein
LAVDPSGARIATGSHDYDTKLWDFGGMDSRFKPFKSWEANGNYYVGVWDGAEADAQVYPLIIIGSRLGVLVRWESAAGNLGNAATQGV